MAVTAVTCFAIVGLLGVLTMARSIGFIDRGELAAVAWTLGVAHPTGYPTLTLIAHVVCRLLPLSPVVSLNLMSVVFVALGAAMLVLLFDHVLERLGGLRRPLTPRWRAVYAGLGTLLLTGTGIWWQQANGFEVYPFHSFLMPLATWLFLRWVDGPRDGRDLRRGLVFAFVLGICFTNHLTTVLLAPAFLTYYFASRGVRNRSVRDLVPLVPAFLVGLLPYVYLPIRAAMNPRLDWGHPDGWDRFVAHVTAWQYRGWMFSSWEVAGQQLRFFFGRLPGEFVVLGLGLVVLGAGVLTRRNPRLALWAGLVFAAAVVFLAGYGIRDIDPYGMPAMLALGVFAVVGITAVHDRAGPVRAAALAGLIVFSSLAFHYRECDESGNHLPEDYARTVLESLPPRAVLFTSQWDYCLSVLLYLQSVENLRPDVTIVNPEFLRRGWYVSHLDQLDPDIGRAVAPEARRFVAAVRPFEHGEPHDSDAIEAAYQSLIHGIAAHALESRRVFATNEVTGPAWKEWTRVPLGPAFEYRADTSYVPQPFPSWRFRPWRNRVDAYVATQSWIYGVLLLSRMNYEILHGRPDEGLRYGSYALSFDPGIKPDDIPPLALDGRELALQSISMFTRLRTYLSTTGTRP